MEAALLNRSSRHRAEVKPPRFVSVRNVPESLLLFRIARTHATDQRPMTNDCFSQSGTTLRFMSTACAE